MATLILNRRSLSVRMEADHIVVRDTADPGAAASTVPLAKVERVLIVGQPAVSFPVLVRLMEKGIPCSFLSSRGRWRGAVGFERGYYAGRRMRQYAKVQEPSFRLRVARHLIVAKIANARRVVQRLCANRKGEDSPEMRERKIQLTQFLAEARACADSDTLRGIEGMAAVHYFGLLRNFFPAELGFQARNRRPPRDPVNALLSWTYAILLEEVIGAIRSHGLDPAAGVMHADTDFSPALALDLIEPLRTGCCDLIVLNLLNHRILKAAHFERDDETGGVRLNEEGRSTFFPSYEKTMQRAFVLPETGERTTLRQIVDRQVCAFLNHLEKGVDVPFFALP